ncbi:uncharacterized protein RAG0_16020 [Rhynchosporium agropyri]|uniref:Uncharacterized protein n=1 Tax=Rhynchosporium agropyri TaxID=914238 RepID=A0A1E1LNF2_9HELO|nr:uncharacterized protein RAG0_16020 [Rhynchosporium agropyri]
MAAGAIAAPHEVQDGQVVKRQTWWCSDTLAAQCAASGQNCDCGYNASGGKVRVRFVHLAHSDRLRRTDGSTSAHYGGARSNV